MKFRCSMVKLEICRASFLAYDQFSADNSGEWDPEFDMIDPCGLGRSVSQRFVEVVMGIQQGNTSRGDPVEYLPADSG